MAKTTTEQVQNSKDKSIIQGIGYREFSAICDEYNIVEKATKELLEIADNLNTPERVKVDIYKWIIEMNIGKPKQMTNPLEDELKEIKITREFIDHPTDDKITGYRMSIVSNKEEMNALKELKQELLEMGCSEEQMEGRIEQVARPLNT